MGLRCLLGHNFGEPELEREREEKGSEVVITVREVKTCQRCGERQIVSENKEVTSIEQLANEAKAAEAEAREGSATDPAGPASGTAEADAGIAEAEEGAGRADWSREPPVDEEGGAELLDEGPDGPAAGRTDPAEPGGDTNGVEADADPAVGGHPGEQTEVEEPEAEESSAEESGVEILPGSEDGAESDSAPEADGEAGGRDGSPTPADAGGWPEVGRETEEADDGTASGDAATDEGPVEDDGVILDEESDASGERRYGEWPEVEEKPEDTGGSQTPWPEHHGDDEGFDATADAGDDGEDDDVGVTFGGGLTPETEAQAEAGGEVDEDVEFIESSPPEPASTDDGANAADGTSTTDGPTSTADGRSASDGSTSRSGDTAGTGASAGDGAAGAGSRDRSRDRSGGRAGRSAPGRDFSGTEGAELTTTMNETATEYYCPECGMTQDTDGGSMRAGDICPECKRGYVTERPL